MPGWGSRTALALAGMACALPSTPLAARDAEAPLSDRIASYTIQVRLDPSAHTLKGSQRLTWRNATTAAAGELQFHLYLNAFKNTRSTFMKESAGRHRGHRLREGGWGHIDVLSMKRSDSGRDLMPGASFISPDDGNPDDETVLRVPLDEPVPPGGTIDLEIEFAGRLPRVFARTGYKGDFHLVAQWFPKIGVLRDSGWNCHQFHAHSEFFSDFGRYDVTLTVPAGFVVGATGAPAGPPVDQGDGTTSWRFQQDDVHDFAWTADPDYVKVVRWFRYREQRDAEAESHVARALGLPEGAAELELGDVEVTLLIQPERASQIDRHFRAAFDALRYYGLWYGRYPYRTLTVVDPAFGAEAAGGMEYPTLITAGTRYFAPAGRHSPESVTIHEFGHQYFYGIVATNEFEEAFLDEGFNTYAQGKILDLAYGPNRDLLEIAPGIPITAIPLLEIPRRPDPRQETGASASWPGRIQDWLLLRPFGPSDDLALNSFRDLPWLNHVTDAPLDDVTNQRRRYLKAPSADSLARRSWEYVESDVYGLNSYARTALALRTLEGILGEETMLKVMREWVRRHRFAHPTFQDFIATVKEASGGRVESSALDDFFRQAFLGSDRLDYAVADLSSRAPKAPAGLFGPPEARRVVSLAQAREEPAPAPDAGPRDNDVLVKRLGGFIWPAQLELRFEQEAAGRREWDGAYRWRRWRETGPPLLSARVDPDFRLALDADWSNNGRTATARPLAGLAWWSRVLTWAQHVVYFYSSLS